MLKQKIKSFLNENKSKQLMATASMQGLAAIEYIAPDLEIILNPIKNSKKDFHYAKQVHIGKEVYEIMTGMGFSHFRYGKKINSSEDFTVGSVYQPNTDKDKLD